MSKDNSKESNTEINETTFSNETELYKQLKDQFEKKIEEQNQNFSKQLADILQLLAKSQQYAINNKDEDKVKIVHLVQRVAKLTTYIKLSNLEIILRDLGEERTVTRQQFEELVGKYRDWFKKGIIGIAAGYENVAETYGLAVTKNYPLTSEFMQNLGTYSMDKIEAVFSRLPESGKEFIIGYWSRKALSGDPQFRDIRKLEVLNRLSDGACTNLILELNKN